MVPYVIQIKLSDDTCHFIEIDNKNTAEELVNEDLNLIHIWAINWLINFSKPQAKTLTIITNANDNPPSLTFQIHKLKKLKLINIQA